MPISGLPVEEELLALQWKCPSSQYRTDRIFCFIEELPRIISAAGLSTTMNALAQLIHSNKMPESGRITGCHDLAHAIGIAGVKASGDIGETLASCTSLCTFGCYHGAVEGYVLQGGDFEHAIKNLCGATAQSDKPACFHGLGHGAAYVGEYTLSKALALCDKLLDEGARRDCGSGVLMELYEPSAFDHPRLEFPEDIPAFCGTLSGVYGEVCFVTAGLHEYGRSLDGVRAFATCERVPSHLRRACITAIGQNFYFVFHGNAQDIMNACGAIGKPDDYQACLEGALTSSIVSDSPQNGFALCEISREDIKKKCYEFLSRTPKRGEK